MLSLMLRSLFWAAWWPASTWLLTLEKASAQANAFFQQGVEPEEAKREPEAARGSASPPPPKPEAMAAETAQPAAAGSAAPKAEEQIQATEDDMASDAFPKMEVPAQLRDLMKMGIEQARTAFENFATTSEKALKALEANPALGGTLAELNEKIAEITRKNAEANFTLAMKLTEAKDFDEALAMQTQHMKAQMEAFAGQIEQIRDLATKLIQERMPGDSTKPFTPQTGPGSSSGPASPGFGAGFGGPGMARPEEGGGGY